MGRFAPTARLVWLSAIMAAGWPAGALARPTALPAACKPLIEAGIPRERLDQLARGFNLTGWLDSDATHVPDEAALRDLRSRGFTHVRLPVWAEFISDRFSAPDRVAAQFRELDDAVDLLLRLGYAVSIDVHPGGRLGRLWHADADAAARDVESIWRVIADRYRDRPSDRLLFELLNEPPSGIDWARRVRHLAEVVRAIAPLNTLVVGPDDNQRVEALEALKPLPDPNVVYAVHYYDPMVFTHQGETWDGPDTPLAALHGVPFPSRPDLPTVVRLRQSLLAAGRSAAAEELQNQLRTPWTPEVVAAAIARAGAWSARYGRAVIVNEFGVLSWVAPPRDRATWLRSVRTAAEHACMGWAHWDYADAFGFMLRRGGRESPDPQILDALIGP